jgi:hypothetical protein
MLVIVPALAAPMAAFGDRIEFSGEPVATGSDVN